MATWWRVLFSKRKCSDSFTTLVKSSIAIKPSNIIVQVSVRPGYKVFPKIGLSTRLGLQLLHTYREEVVISVEHHLVLCRRGANDVHRRPGILGLVDAVAKPQHEGPGLDRVIVGDHHHSGANAKRGKDRAGNSVGGVDRHTVQHRSFII